MRVVNYKLIFYCSCGKETLFSHGEEVVCECGNNFSFDIQSFKSEDEYNEYLFFKDWKEESCANYVGYLLEMEDFNYIVSRESPSESGLYSLTKVKTGVQSNSDPFGERPHLFDNQIHNLNLKEITRSLKIKKLVK